MPIETDVRVDNGKFNAQTLEGKYLTFKEGDEEYGLQILKVQEIIRMQKITKVPKAPSFIRGVINLRGKVIAVIELRDKFGMEHKDDNERTCIIVVKIKFHDQVLTIGIIIDEVKEVLDIKADNIEETPPFGTGINTEFIMGIGKIGENIKMLLDIEKVLTSTDLEHLHSAGE